MTKILDFPTKVVRDWRVIEKALRDVLDGTPADQIAKETIIARMKPVYELCNRSFSITVDVPLPESTSVHERRDVENAIQRAMQQYEFGLHQLTNEILLERLTMEIKRYYESSHGDDSPPS